MICVNPVRLTNPNDGKNMYVGCGKCYGCLTNRRKQWLLRLKKELEYSLSGYHLTLQLDDEHNKDNTVHKDVLQKFIKRLRKKGLKFRYYAIGEYGTNDQRAHYHMAIFIKSDIDFTNFHQLVNNTWQQGYIFITKLNQRRMNYVLHYHTRPKLVNDKPTFSISSNGLGSEWFNDNKVGQWMVESGKSSIKVDGNNYVIPRYYRKKVGAPAKTPNYVYNFQSLACEIYNANDYFELTPKQTSKLKAQLLSISYKKLNNYNSQKKQKND